MNKVEKHKYKAIIEINDACDNKIIKIDNRNYDKIRNRNDDKNKIRNRNEDRNKIRNRNDDKNKIKWW